MMTKNWNEYDIDELGSIVSDYHKDVYGWRPRSPGLYENKAMLVEIAESLDRRFEELKATFGGREQLRADGWVIAETDPVLIQQAKWLAEERARDRAECGDRIFDPFEA
jgi:hypothetical protein